jgi:hypothetical protein
MSKSLLFQPAPPTPTNARKVYGLADSDDGKPRHPANARRAAATKRLTAIEEAQIVHTYRDHCEAATASLRAFRQVQTAGRKNVMRALAKRYGVSLTAIEVAVGTR